MQDGKYDRVVMRDKYGKRCPTFIMLEFQRRDYSESRKDIYLKVWLF